MTYNVRRGERTLESISGMLEELARLRAIEDPVERAEALSQLLPALQNIAQKTEDKRIIDTVDKLAKDVQDSGNYWQAETLRRILNELRANLRKADIFLPQNVVASFSACMKEFDSELEKFEGPYRPLVREMFLTAEQLNHQLIGRRLEKEIAPRLLKQMGYGLGPTVYLHNGREIEIDSLGEKIETSAPDGQGKIQTKSILIVECKTTISEADIRDFSKKVEAIKEKYEQAARIFEHQIQIGAWIMACYGWTDPLKKMAEEKGIKPFDKDDLEETLLRFKLHDRRFPICPEMSE